MVEMDVFSVAIDVSVFREEWIINGLRVDFLS